MESRLREAGAPSEALPKPLGYGRGYSSRVKWCPRLSSAGP